MSNIEQLKALLVGLDSTPEGIICVIVHCLFMYLIIAIPVLQEITTIVWELYTAQIDFKEILKGTNLLLVLAKVIY